MDDYKPNSHRFKEEQEVKSEEPVEEKKQLEKVVKGKVQRRKKSKLKNIFISEDASNIKSYILMDVLIPAIKKAFYDIVTNGIEMALYGESGVKKKSSTYGGSVSYGRYYDSARQREPSYRSATSRFDYSNDDIVISSREEAVEVLERMDELLETYKIVTVADYYDLVGVTCNYTDNKYGWTSLASAQIVRVRDGYVIKLPKVMPVD